jgi:CheY-like chemotaxis protein
MAGRRVLVLDDEPTLCALVSDMLEGTEFEGECAHSDQEAYAAIQTQPPFVALITDVNLGEGTTGFDVGRFARQALPQIAVVYASGEASPESFSAFGVPNSVFLQKPFTSDELLKALREQFDT